MLTVSDAEKLVHAFMTSRLDYCNALLGGCPASSINKLQIVQNAAARVLTRSRKYDHITPILQSLHWLPIKFRISYKIVLLAYFDFAAVGTNYWFVWPEGNWPPDWAWFLPRFFLHSVTDGVFVPCRCRLWLAQLGTLHFQHNHRLDCTDII